MAKVTDKLTELLSELAEIHPDDDLELVVAAHALLAEAASAGEEVDLVAALETASVLVRLRLDAAAVSAAIAAPLLLHTATRVDELSSKTLSDDVIGLLEGVQRLYSIRWDRLEEEAAESLRKMFLAMARDVRVVVIVLAMRVQLMRTLHEVCDDDERAARIARETLDVFAPLANRLGIWQLKWELEDWALRVLEPAAFAELERKLNETREERTAFVDGVLATLRSKLAEEGIDAQIYGRPKHIYSIYKKMQRKQLSFEHIFDVSAVRIITEKMTDCYAALGLVHSLWLPLPSEFDDYIAKPKENRYQSLHTAVVGPKGRPFEAQIRTQEMHTFAEFGVAAHWAYKERRKAGQKADEKFMVLRQLMNWEREVADPHQFVESLKTDIFEDQVYVFTPNGDIIDLPVGSTPLDFAYRIHTEVGHRCRGARVNDAIQSLDYQLKTGDRIEILTSKTSQPSRDWTNPSFGYLRTASARTKVRQWYRAQARDTAVQEGRELIEKELKRLGLKHATVDEIAVVLKYDKTEDLFAAVGYGDRHPQGVGSAALQVEREKAPPSEPPIPPSLPSPQRKRSASGLSLDGVDDILGKRARCCNPVPGDEVLGFVTRGRGIVIHRRDCSHITKTREPERLVEIDWGPGEQERHPVDVEIRAHDRPGLLRDLSNLVSNAGVNMTSARAEAHKDGSAWLKLSLEFQSAEQVVKILQRIDKLPDVLEVRRLAH